MFYLHIENRIVSGPPLSVFCTFILLSQLPTSPEILAWWFSQLSSLPWMWEVRRESWLLGSWVVQGLELLMIQLQIEMGWIATLPPPSGAQRSSCDSSFLLTKTLKLQVRMLQTGEDHLPKYLLSSILGYRVLEHHHGFDKTSLCSKNNGCGAASCSWLWGFVTYMCTYHEVWELEKFMNGIFPGETQLSSAYVPVLICAGCKCFSCV